MEFIQPILSLLNQVFEAGIAITALSLFIRSLSFNLRDRVAQSFAIILACVMFVYSGEAISAALTTQEWLWFWLRFQWVGLVILPAGVFHFADALLATTGRPSRGRRRKTVYLSYIISLVFIASLLTGNLVKDTIIEDGTFFRLSPGILFGWFTGFYLLSTMVSPWLIWRAYRRTRLPVSRRRVMNLLVGIVFLAVGTYPYIQLGSQVAVNYPYVFQSAVLAANLVIFFVLMTMAYSVAFFGVAWPDRVVRSRLLKWMLRGPVTLFMVLAFMTFAYRAGEFFGSPISVVIPIITVITVLFMEHLITLVFPYWERWFFHGGDRHNIGLVQALSERLITERDLEQFLQTVLGAVCDQFQVSTAFIAALGENGLERVVQVGDREALNKPDLNEVMVKKVIDSQKNGNAPLFGWGDFWVYPIYNFDGGNILGLLGVLKTDDVLLDLELTDALVRLGQRAAMALENRLLQRDMFQAIEKLNPSVDVIQKLRAASRFDQREILASIDTLDKSNELILMVKDALGHYWGGPKLSKSPLMRLKIVQIMIEDYDSNPVNALRAILKKGIEQVKPEGERRFTGEWILYNILEMKFMEGRKVKEIALRLAMSEADLYRKQNVAIEAVAGAIVDMEKQARRKVGDILDDG